MGHFIVFFLLGFTIFYVASSPLLKENNMEKPRKLCGEELREVFIFVCDEVHNAKYVRGVVLNFTIPLTDLSFRKDLKGLVQDCCYDACTLSQMAMYCSSVNNESDLLSIKKQWNAK